MQPAERHTFQHGDATLGYLLYRPAAVDQEIALPLILFLHGRGESGDDLELVKLYGLPAVLERGDELPALVIAPQCPAAGDWEAQTANLAALLDDVCAREQVDEARVYLTGLSMGGRGSWLLALAHPARFAAVACMASRIPFAIRPTPDFTPLQTTPIWIFHGARDPIAPLSDAEALAAALRAAGADPRVTIYPDADHDAWTAAYNDPALYTWLFAQRKGLP